MRESYCYLQVVGQIVLLQGVSLKAMRCRVKVVITDPTNETFSLRTEIREYLESMHYPAFPFCTLFYATLLNQSMGCFVSLLNGRSSDPKHKI